MQLIKRTHSYDTPFYGLKVGACRRRVANASSVLEPPVGGAHRREDVSQTCRRRVADVSHEWIVVTSWQPKSPKGASKHAPFDQRTGKFPNKLSFIVALQRVFPLYLGVLRLKDPNRGLTRAAVAATKPPVIGGLASAQPPWGTGRCKTGAQKAVFLAGGLHAANPLDNYGV